MSRWACLMETASTDSVSTLHTPHRWGLHGSGFRPELCNLPRSDLVWFLLSSSALTFKWSVSSLRRVLPFSVTSFYLNYYKHFKSKNKYVLSRELAKCPDRECYGAIVPWLWTSKLHCFTLESSSLLTSELRRFSILFDCTRHVYYLFIQK